MVHAFPVQQYTHRDRVSSITLGKSIGSNEVLHTAELLPYPVPLRSFYWCAARSYSCTCKLLGKRTKRVYTYVDKISKIIREKCKKLQNINEEYFSLKCKYCTFIMTMRFHKC